MNSNYHHTSIDIHPAHLGMRWVLLGIFTNIILVLVKGTAGVWGHSYALVADAIESTTDIFSSILVYIGLKISTKPPDKNHPYGHGKAEPLSAVSIALFLFLAAICIAYQSFLRIQNPHQLPSPWTLVVLISVILIKEGLYKFASRIAAQTSSNALKGDAIHHRSDAITSLAAFLGISIALIGNHFKPDPYWSCADDWAAMVASIAVAYNGWVILYQAIYELTDAKPDAQIEIEIRKVALTVTGVKELDKCSVRKMGLEYYVELDVRVDRDMPVFQAHDISHQVQNTIREKVQSARIAKVLIHIEPSRKVS